MLCHCVCKTCSCKSTLIHFFFVSSLKGLNKFKKRKYLKTKNLLTGETDASPDLIKVSTVFTDQQTLNLLVLMSTCLCSPLCLPRIYQKFT